MGADVSQGQQYGCTFVADAGSRDAVDVVDLSADDVVARDERGVTYRAEIGGVPCLLAARLAGEATAQREYEYLLAQGGAAGGRALPRPLAFGTFVAHRPWSYDDYAYGYATEYVEGFSFDEVGLAVEPPPTPMPGPESGPGLHPGSTPSPSEGPRGTEHPIGSTPKPHSVPAGSSGVGRGATDGRPEPSVREGVRRARDVLAVGDLTADQAEQASNLYADVYARAVDSNLDLSFALEWARLKLDRGDLTGCESLCRELERDHRVALEASEIRGACLVAQGRLAQADDVLRGAVASYRRHPRAERARGHRGLATALLDLARCQLARGAYEEALATTREALGRWHDEVAGGAGVPSELVDCLLAQGDCLVGLGQDGAEEAYRQALGLARQHVARADGSRVPLVRSLCALAELRLGGAPSEDELALCEEALGLARELAEMDWDHYLPWMARSLSVRGTLLAGSDVVGARDAYREALSCCKELVARNRGLDLRREGVCRLNLCLCELRLGHGDDAERLAEAAAAELGECWRTDPSPRATSLYVYALRMLADVSYQQGRPQTARDYRQRATEVERGLARLGSQGEAL